MSHPSQPRLYLDIDGVLLANHPSFDDVRQYDCYGANWSPMAAQRLGACGMELVWLSTWGDEVHKLVEKINDLRGGRVLEREIASDRHLTGVDIKYNALVKDQCENPSPFVWIEDQIKERHRIALQRRLSNQSMLLIAPDPQQGLNADELADVERFTAGLTRYRL